MTQAILACSFAEKDYDKVTAAATRALQMSFVLGVGLSLLVGVGLFFGAGIFTKSVLVIHLIRTGIPVHISFNNRLIHERFTYQIEFLI